MAKMAAFQECGRLAISKSGSLISSQNIDCASLANYFKRVGKNGKNCI